MTENGATRSYTNCQMEQLDNPGILMRGHGCQTVTWTGDAEGRGWMTTRTVSPRPRGLHTETWLQATGHRWPAKCSDLSRGLESSPREHRRHPPNACLTLAQRRRRWTSIKHALNGRLLYSRFVWRLWLLDFWRPTSPHCTTELAKWSCVP